MNIQFAFPISHLPGWMLAGAALLVAVGFGLRWLEERRKGRLCAFAAANLAGRLAPELEARSRRPLFWFPLAGLAFALVALAQPHWGAKSVAVERSGRDILVLLDTSPSMGSTDIPPSRMARARQKIEALSAMCPGDRFGLVVFAGSAQLQCPLTLDHGYFRMILEAMGTGVMSRSGTDIATALRYAENVYREDIDRSGAQQKHRRAVLLLSDGEQVSGDAVAAARSLSKYLAVYVLGLGSREGGEVSQGGWGGQVAGAGGDSQTHLSALDEDTLSQIAFSTGGLYVRSTPGNQDVRRIHREMESLSTRAVTGDLRFTLVNRYRWPLWLAFLCFFGEGLSLALLPWRKARTNEAVLRSQ